MKTRRKFEGNLTLALLAKIYDPAKIDNAQSQALLTWSALIFVHGRLECHKAQSVAAAF